METYLVTAKTVEEAIAAANREYAKNGKEISYEILEMPKKGFLGIGARDAKLKVTVTESASSQIGSELSSIVADLRGMKVQTNRGGSEKEDRPQKNQNNQKKPQNQQNQQNQGKQKTQNQQNSQKTQNQQPQKAQPQNSAKQSANSASGSGSVNQSAPKAQKPQNQQKPAQTKAERPERSEKPERTERPEKNGKGEKPAREKADNKPQNAASEKPERTEKAKTQQNQQEKPRAERPERTGKPERLERSERPEKNEKTEHTPVVLPAQTKIPVQIDSPMQTPAQTDAPTQDSQSAEKPQSENTARHGSSLRNQVKPPHRAPQPKKQISEDVSGAEAIIASPVGLSDFTSENEGAASFGAGTGSNASGGRMSNDIRKKQRPAKPAKQEKPAVSENAPDGEAAEAAPAAFDPERIETVETFSEAFGSFESENESAVDMQPEPQDRQKVGVSQAEMDYALLFANTLLKNMQIDAVAKSVPCPEGEEYVIEGDANVYPKIDIEGEGTGILIGHHGETLDAVQYLVNLAALRQSKQKGGDYVRIVVDIENYRVKREETLRALARRMASRAVKYRRNVFLEPMNAYERRIIHSELHDYPNVSTHSVGADKNRKIIITYEGADKVSAPRRDREKSANGENGGSAGASRRTDRRPKKIQKMPIDKLPDFLAAGTASDEPAESPEFED